MQQLNVVGLEAKVLKTSLSVQAVRCYIKKRLRFTSDWIGLLQTKHRCVVFLASSPVVAEM